MALKVFIITKGTLYYGNTIGRGLLGVGTQHSLQTVRPRRYSQNLNVSVLCPLPPTFGLSRVYDSITLTDKTPKTGKISTKMCRSIHHTGLPIMLDRLNIRNWFISTPGKFLNDADVMPMIAACVSIDTALQPKF